MSDEVSDSNAEPNSAPPPTKLENSPPAKNSNLKHVRTGFIFNINENRFESEINENDKASLTI